MKAYLSLSYSKRRSIENEISVINDILNSFQIEAFIFVDQYSFQQDEEKKMMHQTLSDIDECDFLIAEVSDKAIGVGVEVGYAKAKNKPIIYLRHSTAEHSTTISGVSDYSIFYNDINDLKGRLSTILKSILVDQKSYSS